MELGRLKRAHSTIASLLEHEEEVSSEDEELSPLAEPSVELVKERTVSRVSLLGREEGRAHPLFELSLELPGRPTSLSMASHL